MRISASLLLSCSAILISIRFKVDCYQPYKHFARNQYLIDSKNFNTNSLTSYQIPNLIQHVLNFFSFQVQDIEHLKKRFDLKNAELIYPDGYEKVLALRRCVIGSRLRSTKNYVAIKLEFDNDVRAKLDDYTRQISCQAYYINGMPTEKYIAHLMQNRPYFITFYSNISNQFQSQYNKAINMYVYERLVNSSNMADLVENLRKKAMRNSELEKYLKIYYSQAHNALTQLYDRGYIYTDFKPHNILVDHSNRKAYLIDLESVVDHSSKFVCLRTTAFTPPLYDSRGYLISTDSLSRESVREFFDGSNSKWALDRVLTWSFCISLYSSLCLKGNDIFQNEFKSKFKYWGRDKFPFAIYFGCHTGSMSKEFIDLLNQCLVIEQKQPIFKQLSTHKWFQTGQ
jgi:serine/threonine protein kinase